MKKQKDFNYSFMAPDSRPRVTAVGFSGKKTAWIQIECANGIFGGRVSKALVKQLMK